MAYVIEHATRTNFDNVYTITLSAQIQANKKLLEKVFEDNGNKESYKSFTNRIQFNVSLCIDNARDIDKIIDTEMCYTLHFDSTSIQIQHNNILFANVYVKQIEEDEIEEGYMSDEPEPYLDDQIDLCNATRVRVDRAMSRLETLKQICGTKQIDLDKINYINSELDRNNF